MMRCPAAPQASAGCELVKDAPATMLTRTAFDQRHHVLSVKRDVLVRNRVLQRLEMGDYRSTWQGVTDVALHAFGEIMPMPNGPGAGNQNVHLDKAACARFAGAQCMEIDAFVPIARKDVLDAGVIFGRQGLIHESGGGTVNELPARPYNVQGDQESDQWVEPQPACQCDGADAENDPR